MEERARKRRARIVTHRAKGFADAEAWDLEYWQSRSPQDRQAAFLALRRDVEKVLEARSSHEKPRSGHE